MVPFEKAQEAPAAPAEFDAWWGRAGDGRSKLMAKQAWDAALAEAPQAPAAPVDDLAALVKQLVQALRKAAPNHVLPAKALDYLRRQDLLGSPLRVASAAPVVDASRTWASSSGDAGQLAVDSTDPVAWAVSRWEAEVKQRPLVNVHRRSLDDTWRQVIRHFGGDPEALVGPSHDDLLAAQAAAQRGQP